MGQKTQATMRKDSGHTMQTGRQRVSDEKHFGRVYTPRWVVDHMLRPLRQTKMERLTICDPACGVGDFLIPVAEALCARIMAAPPRRAAGLRDTLSRLTGYDVDSVAVDECQRRLTETVGKLLGETAANSDWNVHVADAIDASAGAQGTCDWVVGNPPYVRIQHLEADRRAKIQQGGWGYYHGASDLYIVFFELGMRLLKQGGQLRFISPSGWVRNAAGRSMREQIDSLHTLVSLHDFRDFQVFPGVSTYTCITHLRKGRDSMCPDIRLWNGADFHTRGRIIRTPSQWGVAPMCGEAPSAGARLGDIADIRVGIQTLADRVFILNVAGGSGDTVDIESGGDRFTVEAGAVRRIVKASVMKEGRDKAKRVVIYPYDSRGKLLPEPVFARLYPLAYAWLVKHKDVLLARDKGAFSKAKWYGYGREVGITTGFGRKILTSSMNPEPNFQICEDPDTLFYSGYCIKPRNGVSLTALQAVLNSDEMRQHIEALSQPFRGGWFSYAKRYIQEFPVPQHLMQEQIVASDTRRTGFGHGRASDVEQ